MYIYNIYIYIYTCSGGKKNPDLLLFYQKRTNESKTINEITKNSYVCTLNTMCILGVVVFKR